jgi:hypothetical protein
MGSVGELVLCPESLLGGAVDLLMSASMVIGD